MGVRRFGLVLLLLAACSSANDEELPFSEASHARGLPFLRRPAVVTRTRASYAEETEKAITDADVLRYRTVWGRLGFVPTDFDPRAVAKLDAERVAAFYDPNEGGGQITRFDGDEDRGMMVHELVHALQDQHFGLQALDDSAGSTDEWLASRALVEGDATVAETRSRLESSNRDPFEAAPGLLSNAAAREQSEKFLATEGIPAFLSAYVSFCYGFGSIVVAKAVGLGGVPPRWDTAGADALYRGGAPRSTEGVLRAGLGIEIDPIVETGLVRLPAPLSERYEIRDVDRLGAWLAWILLREAGEQSSDIAMDWDGDQLVVIGPKDPAQPPVALVWTTAWENELDAETVVRDLQRLHAAAAESLVIERRGVEVVFAKGTIPMSDAHALANAAFYERTSGERPAAARNTVDHARFFR